MKKSLIVLFSLVIAVGAFAQQGNELNETNGNGHAHVSNYAGGGGSGNLTFHTGGVVIRNANVVCIFWGPSFAAGQADNGYATQIQGFRNQFGSTPEYNTITQYYGNDSISGYGNIATGSLINQADMFDTTTPPQNVTDATVQSEVRKYVAANGTDYNTIYEVFIPSGSFSSDGTSGSCGATGGVSLAYCAYHSHYVDGTGNNLKYSIQPLPGCSGCQVS